MAGFWHRVRGAARSVVAFFAVPGFLFDSPPKPVDRLIADMLGRGASGPRVSRAEALSVPAVTKGRNQICSIATLPLIQLDAKNAVVRNPLLEQIDPDVPNVVTLAQTVEDLLFEGIAWWEVTARDFAGFPIAARHLAVESVSLTPPPGTRRTQAPLPSGRDPREASVWVDGIETPASRVVRFDSPNPGLLQFGGRAIRRAIALDQAATMYADDPRPLDYFTPAEGADPIPDEEVRGILAEWKQARKKRSTAYIPTALKYESVDSPSPRELQIAELDKAAGLKLANALGVDPEDLGISTTSRTYSNAVDRRRDRINEVLSPYMLALTQRLSMGDITRRSHRVIFDLDDYLRANPTERWSNYKTAHEIGAITVNEIRAEENLPPLPEDAEPAERPAPSAPADEVDEADDQEEPTVAAVAGPAWTLEGDDNQPMHFDLPVHGFAVNRQRRTIEGMAVPWGVTGQKYGLKFRFMRGALRWSAVERVKLLRDHDMRQPLGVATSLSNSDAGLKVRFKVGRGAEGDRALELAEDKVLDGLSVGVDFDLANDTEMDPNDDSVMLVRRADLREVSLTAMPAFDDARVSKVAASRAEGTAMPCSKCGQTHAPDVACTAAPTTTTNPTSDTQTASQPAGLNLSQEQLQALLSRPGALQALVQAQTPPTQPAAPAGALQLSAEQVDALIKSGGLATLLGMPQLTPPPQPAERPRVVDPTRRPVQTARVKEELPYRFDRRGNLTRGTKYDFSTDIINGSRGDGEALERAQKFVASQFPEDAKEAARMQFDTDMADVDALNPDRQRPDLYVDQQEFMYPIWDAINKGTIPDATPFVLPKFASASGLVANHAEGTEPTPGTFTATSQTITPTPVSGKVEITREAWEQGGNPQLSGIVWRQMLRAWFEALEAASVTHLDGLTPTSLGALTTGNADTGQTLVAELTGHLAGLQFARGGFRMRDFFVQIDLYKGLVGARDADGRPILPVMGPVNANGQTTDFFGDVIIGGLRGRPAWALAASGSVAASSYLFDRNDVHAWASAPQRLQFEYRVAYVDVAIWGYKALATTDLTGVREVIWDPQV